MANFLNCEILPERLDLLEVSGTFRVKIDSKTYSVCHKDHFEVWQKLIRSLPFWSWYPYWTVLGQGTPLGSLTWGRQPPGRVPPHRLPQLGIHLHGTLQWGTKDHMKVPLTDTRIASGWAVRKTVSNESFGFRPLRVMLLHRWCKNSLLQPPFCRKIVI